MVRTEVEKVDRIAGGFVLVPVAELMRAWHASRTAPLGIADFRAYLALREMVARRCHVLRDRDRSPRFDFPELAKLLGVTEKRTRASVRRLEVAGLIAWSAEVVEFRVPSSKNEAEVDSILDTIGRGHGSVAIPRRMLRHLVAGGRPALIATVLGVLLRCLSRRKAGFDGRGRVKASWIARAFEVSIPAVKLARRELVELGWIEPRESSQWSMNRFGRLYHIDLEWSSLAPSSGPASIPPRPDLGPTSTPPDLHQEPLAERQENQEPARGLTGVEIKGKEGASQTPETNGDPVRTKLISTQPRLDDVQVADLKDTGRLLQLHDQAVAKGLVTTAEADRLRVVASAEHALAVGKANPAGLFAHLIRNRAWRYLTGEDEDRANGRIKAFLRGPEPSRSPAVATPFATSRPVEPGLSDDARMVREIRAACSRAGIFRDPWPAFSARNPEWDRGRWDRAMVELGLG